MRSTLTPSIYAEIGLILIAPPLKIGAYSVMEKLLR